MKVAIDVSPLQTGHKVRGVGFYLEHLKDALIKYFPGNDYIFFERGEQIPKDVDLVHFPYFEPFFLALPIYRKYKSVVTVHDLTPIVFPKAFPRGLRGEIKWQMQRFSLKKADSVITDSESSKKDVIKYVGISAHKISVVYLAAGEKFKVLDPGPWINKTRKKFNLPQKFVLYVGDVTWNKNLPRLLDAVKEVGLTIVMVGKNLVNENYEKDNPWNNDLNRVWELSGENKKVIRLGFVADEDLVAIYNLATVFVMPSLYEGFGLPVLEAMASGCPVITSIEASLREITNDSALIIDPYDYKSIAQGIKTVFNDEELRKDLTERGLNNVRHYSWKKTAEETIGVYKKVIGS